MNDQSIITEACITEYKGNPILNLPSAGKGFAFGLKKAQMIQAQWNNIVAFVESKGKSTVDINVEISEYYDKPTLCLNPNDQYKFSFQIVKATTILEHEFEINKFVGSNGKGLK